MDLPILKYVDIAIGLAIVILLLCTVVTAVTQMLLAYTYSRARYLRNGLEDLIRQIDPATLDKQARYIAERCLRHPLLARNNTPFGKITGAIRNFFRSKMARDARHLLPELNPPDVIQREELILMLLDWAAGEGPLAQQDKDLIAKSEGKQGEALAAVQQILRDALANNGVVDPGLAAKAIRAKIVELENANPQQSSALARALAVAAAAPSDFVGKIHVWFDNTMARIGEQYGLLAQVWAAVLACAVVFGCQFDALDLLKRLSQDDKLRADLVQQAKDQTARIDKAQKDAADAHAAPNASQQKEIADAATDRQQISASLAVLRDPSRAILPSYFIWQDVAQALVCPTGSATGVVKGHINVDADYREFQIEWAQPVRDNLATAIRSSGAPVAVYAAKDKPCVQLVARNSNVGSIVVALGTGGLITLTGDRGIDWPGIHNRLFGMILAAILVSLGAPFWFNLLKKLLGLRSMLAQKDDQDRQQRQTSQTTPPPSGGGGGGNPTGPAGGADERGDLSATGAAG